MNTAGGGGPTNAADTFLVSCIDPRVTDDTAFAMAALGRTGRYSEMRIAGAALAAVDEGRPAWSAALWDNLAASKALHGIRRVTFLNHRDCGAMHIWAGRTLSRDPADELRVHADVMNRAAAEVRRRHPDLIVDIKLMDLDGSVTVLPCPACAPAGGLRADAVEPPGARRADGSAVRVDSQGYANLARVRLAKGLQADAAGETDLLAEGITHYGLTAAEARQIVRAVGDETGRSSRSAIERSVATFVRMSRDRHGRIRQRDFHKATRFYRVAAQNEVSEAEAAREVAAIMRREGIEPRPAGIWPFRSTSWFDRMGGPGR
jgi:hypothetical protein